MNFDDTPQEAAFRAEARKWIDSNAPKEFEAELSKSSLGRIRLQNEEIVDVGKAWQKKKAEAGWACLHWPKEYGGLGAAPIERGMSQPEGGPCGKLSAVFSIVLCTGRPSLVVLTRGDQETRQVPPPSALAKICCP